MSRVQVIEAGSADMHQMVLVGRRVDALTGEEWDVLECPVCGYLCKKQWDPYQNVDLRLGEGMLTKEDVDRIMQLSGQGPVGRTKAQKILSRAPGHGYVRVPTEDELRQMAREAGQEAEFEAAVDRAIVEGKPLLTFGMGGVEASTWPKGF